MLVTKKIMFLKGISVFPSTLDGGHFAYFITQDPNLTLEYWRPLSDPY